MDFDAIIKAYPSIITLSEDFVNYGLDTDGNKVSIVQSDIDAARTTLNNELAATKYQRDRAAEYPSVVDQLDLIYHSGVDAWKAKIKETKDKYPKS
tara:strand:- start:44 stop:331 length:288 start_codon:yes stop_codon:yes gene_type:complete